MNERQTLLDFPGADALQAAGRVEPPSAQALARAMAAVHTAVRDEAVRHEAQHEAPQHEAVVTPIRRRRFGAGRRMVATGLAAAAVAAGAVVYAGQGSGTPAGHAPQQARTVTVQTFLNDTAEVAATMPASSGKYWKMHVRSTPAHGASNTFDAYLYVTRSMEYYVVDGHGTHKKSGYGDFRLGPMVFGWKGLDQLPTDPVKLLKIMQSSKEYAGQSAFLQTGFLLGGSPASPKLRAALFRAVARIDGVKLVGTVKDHAGRKGTELVRNDIGQSSRMIIDPATSRLLELVNVSTMGKDRGAAHTQTFLSVGFADRIG